MKRATHAADGVHDADGGGVVGRGERAGVRHAVPRHALHVARGQRPAEGGRARFERGGHVGGDDHAGGLAPAGFVDLGRASSTS